MPPSHTPPAPPGRGPRTSSTLGTSASYLLVTILSANQAAARPVPSLPYLVQAAPIALRFSLPRIHSAPPPPIRLEPPSEADGLPDYDPTHLDQGPPLHHPTPAVIQPADTRPPGPPTPDIPPGAPGSVPLIPDRYGPAKPVRVEDLLPFLLPAPRPVSRATYQIK